MKGIAIILLLTLLSACSYLNTQSKPSTIITKTQMQKINNGMSYEQICSILGSPGTMKGPPRKILLWSQNGCYLQIQLDQNRVGENHSWCDKICKEIDGKKWCRSDISNPYSDKINSTMTLQEVIQTVGNPQQQQEVFEYSWRGVDGPHINDITILMLENKAFQVYTFSLEDK